MKTHCSLFTFFIGFYEIASINFTVHFFHYKLSFKNAFDNIYPYLIIFLNIQIDRVTILVVALFIRNDLQLIPNVKISISFFRSNSWRKIIIALVYTFYSSISTFMLIKINNLLNIWIYIKAINLITSPNKF